MKKFGGPTRPLWVLWVPTTYLRQRKKIREKKETREKEKMKNIEAGKNLNQSLNLHIKRVLNEGRPIAAIYYASAVQTCGIFLKEHLAGTRVRRGAVRKNVY